MGTAPLNSGPGSEFDFNQATTLAILWFIDRENNQRDLHHQIENGAKKFFEISKASDVDFSLSGSIVGEIVSCVLAIAPAAGPVLKAFTKLAEGLSIAAKPELLATIAAATTDSALSIAGSTVSSLGGDAESPSAEAELWELRAITAEFRRIRDEIRRQRTEFLTKLVTLRASPPRLGFQAWAADVLGTVPEDGLLEHVATETELRLYEDFYKHRVSVRFLCNPMDSRCICVVDGMPTQVQERIRVLSRYATISSYLIRWNVPTSIHVLPWGDSETSEEMRRNPDAFDRPWLYR